MSENGQQVPLNVKEPTMKYYDEGWNARCGGEPYKPTASRDWRDGWKDADEAPKEDQKEMN